MWNNSFCCRDCGAQSYCIHKMNVAQNIYSTINNEQEERTYKEMEQLSIEEQFNIYTDIVPPIPQPPPSSPPSQTPFQKKLSTTTNTTSKIVSTSS